MIFQPLETIHFTFPVENDDELEEDDLLGDGDSHPNHYHTFGHMDGPSKYKDIGECEQYPSIQLLYSNMVT